ncbi:MAG: hypothetical protein MI976_22140 [Pseudomonadales bacterium]|nr:hypothetical protein [Pseudomonadales bacterium]
MKKRLLCITPVLHIEGLMQRLEKVFDVVYIPDPDSAELAKHNNCNIIFTNPNKTKVYLGKESLNTFSDLEVIATASTGTVHIDKDYCQARGVRLISLTREIPVLERISSTAEHAFLLTLAACRNIIPACRSVDHGEWDYERFVGRQLNQLVVGVVGFGRLGKMYSHYAKSFGARVLVCDPYLEEQIETSGYSRSDLQGVFTACDIISLHIHATQENQHIVNVDLLDKAKSNLMLINTSRGEVINEKDLLKFILDNPTAKYYTDVLTDEYLGLNKSLLYSSEVYGKQIVVTPHIGGMTIDAQLIAYNHCLDMVCELLEVGV